MTEKKEKFRYIPLPAAAHLTESQKKRKEQKFLMGATGEHFPENPRRTKNNQQLNIRICDSLNKDIELISMRLGISKNAACIELLSRAIELRMKSLSIGYTDERRPGRPKGSPNIINRGGKIKQKP